MMNTVSALGNVIATRCHGNTISFLCSSFFDLNQLSAFTKMYQLSPGSFTQSVYSSRPFHSSILNENWVRNVDQGQQLWHAIFFIVKDSFAYRPYYLTYVLNIDHPCFIVNQTRSHLWCVLEKVITGVKLIYHGCQTICIQGSNHPIYEYRSSLFYT